MERESYIDIVMCIDTTGSMEYLIENVKEKSLSFCRDLSSHLEKEGKKLDKLRVKVISFKDSQFDKDFMLESKFFTLDEEKEELYSFVKELKAQGGGDRPESSYEALALAMKSDWTRSKGGFGRHLIIMFTDAPPRPLEEGNVENAPKSYGELYQLWDSLERRKRRMYLCAPYDEHWSRLTEWESVVHVECADNMGCGEIDMELCFRIISQTL